MAEASWPDTSHNARSVTDVEYEQLVASYAGEGIIGSIFDPPPVYGNGSGMQVLIRANYYATLRGHIWSSGGADLVKTIAPNSSGSTRTDMVVLGLNRASSFTVTSYVKQGVGANPPSVQRDLGTTGIYEIPLALVRVNNGVTAINSNDVTHIGYYAAPSSVVANSALNNWVPKLPGRELVNPDTGKRLVTFGSDWRPTLTESSGMRLIGQNIINIAGPYIVTNVVNETQFAQFQAFCEPGHLYQLSLDVNVRRGDSGGDDTMFSCYMYTDGYLELDTGSYSVPGLNNFRHVHADVPFSIGGSPRTVNCTASLRRVLGAGWWHVMGDPHTGMWFRCYDLGVQ